MMQTKTQIIPPVRKILKRHGIKKAELVGSYARGDHTDDSDIDIVVELAEDTTLLDMASIQLELEDELNRGIDLVSYGGVSDRLAEYLFTETVQII
jgi:predicted nucleotidyltransferase